jgi:hypothetical protein
LVFVGVAVAGLSPELPEPELDPELFFDESVLLEESELGESVLVDPVLGESVLVDPVLVEDDPESEDPERLSFL